MGGMRTFTAAAVQLAPVPGPLTAESIKANVDKCVEYVERCVGATGAELVVLPEAATTGFTPAIPPEALWDLVGGFPDPLREAAQAHRVHLVVGCYTRGGARGTVYNTAGVIGPTGEVLGEYHKTHVFCGEGRAEGGWVTPGERATVVPTELGRIGMMICFDGDYPELARIQAVAGAEVICRPSALLRSADIWELTTRARAYDNHVFVVAANATGADPGGALYFGNSLIVSPIAEVLARGASHEGWVSARLDPGTAMRSLTPGSSVPQRFDHLADRNLALIENHLAELRAPARSSFMERRA
jgi:deaminated glutathione amidase